MIPKNIGDLVTFVPNKFLPIHNWFYYKEGFSRGLVDWLVRDYKLQEPILDPFCGSGTTLLSAKQKGLKAIGTDVSPLSVFVSKAKTRNYDINSIKEKIEKMKKQRAGFDRLKIDKRIRRLFYSETLNDILELKAIVDNIENENEQLFFKLALVDTTGRVANVKKVGGSLRKEKKEKLPVKKLFFGKCKKMLIDLEKTSLTNVEPEVFEGDARDYKFEKESVGSVITSPPYLNKIEYTTVYKMELGMFFSYPKTQLRAFIADEPKSVTGLDELPLIAQAYFEDLEKVLKNIHNALIPNGIACINLSGGCFPEKLVEADEILEKIAEKVGFTVKERIVARQIQCHKDRSFKTGKVRESIVILEKK
jgi:DNA modification methylase